MGSDRRMSPNNMQTLCPGLDGIAFYLHERYTERLRQCYHHQKFLTDVLRESAELYDRTTGRQCVESFMRGQWHLLTQSFHSRTSCRTRTPKPHHSKVVMITVYQLLSLVEDTMSTCRQGGRHLHDRVLCLSRGAVAQARTDISDILHPKSAQFGHCDRFWLSRNVEMAILLQYH